MGNQYYKGMIKVVTPSMVCFPIDPSTLNQVAAGSYDPTAFSAPDPVAMETITAKEWYKRLLKKSKK